MRCGVPRTALEHWDRSSLGRRKAFPAPRSRWDSFLGRLFLTLEADGRTAVLRPPLPDEREPDASAPSVTGSQPGARRLGLSAPFIAGLLRLRAL